METQKFEPLKQIAKMTELGPQPPPEDQLPDPAYVRRLARRPKLTISNLHPDLIRLFTKNLHYLLYCRDFLHQGKNIPVGDQSRVKEIDKYFSRIKNGNAIQPYADFGRRKGRTKDDLNATPPYVPFGRQMVRIQKDVARPKATQCYVPVLITTEKQFDTFEELLLNLKEMISLGDICGIAGYWHTATLVVGHTLLRPEFKTQVENLLFPVYLVDKKSPTNSRIVSAVKRGDGSSYDFEFRFSDPYQPILVGSTVLAFRKVTP